MFKNTALNLLKKAIVKTKCYNLKLFYFSIYCLLLVGCGKKIEQPQDQDVRQERLESQIIKLNAKIFSNGNAVDEEHEFTTDSEVRIPDSLQVIEGNAGNHIAKIYFNVDENDNFEFYCKYVGGASNATPNKPEEITSGHYYHFDTCYMQENDQQEINLLPGYESIQYKDKSVLFKLVGADPRFDTQAAAEFEVETH